jgi:hypothetical protein
VLRHKSLIDQPIFVSDNRIQACACADFPLYPNLFIRWFRARGKPAVLTVPLLVSASTIIARVSQLNAIGERGCFSLVRTQLLGANDISEGYPRSISVSPYPAGFHNPIVYLLL